MTGQVKAISFADRLKRLMYEQRVSSAALSESTGISERLIRKYRSGQTEPRDAWGDPTENAQKLARALDVRLDELVAPIPLEEAA